jgi:hypothetical protein
MDCHGAPRISAGSRPPRVVSWEVPSRNAKVLGRKLETPLNEGHVVYAISTMIKKVQLQRTLRC